MTLSPTRAATLPDLPLVFAHMPAVPANQQAQETRMAQQRDRVPFEAGPIGLQASAGVTAGGRVGTGGVGAWDHSGPHTMEA